MSETARVLARVTLEVDIPLDVGLHASISEIEKEANREAQGLWIETIDGRYLAPEVKQYVLRLP